jgi:hypothetical protein
MPLPIHEIEIVSEPELDGEHKHILICQIIDRVECQRDSLTLQIADFPFTAEEETKVNLYRRQLVFSRVATLDHPKLIHLVFNLIEMTEDEIVIFDRYQLLDENDILNASKKLLQELTLNKLREKWYSLL